MFKTLTFKVAVYYLSGRRKSVNIHVREFIKSQIDSPYRVYTAQRDREINGQNSFS